MRARILATFDAGRCLLFTGASAGPDCRAVEGDGWVYDAGRRLDRCDSAMDLAATVLARHSAEEIRKALEWTWRDRIEANHHDAAEAMVWSLRDRISPEASRQNARFGR